MNALARFRFLILIKQKLGWGLLAGAALFFPFALFMSFSSYVRPDKIYFDLSLSFCFGVVVLICSYLGTHLFAEENQRKTLSFVLTLKASRRQWLFGNWLGIVAMMGFTLLIATVLLSVGSLAVSRTLPPLILFQAQIFLFLEAAVVLSVALLVSLLLKPLLGWFAVLALIALLHSKTYLEVLVVEADFSGITRMVYDSILFVLNFLPPLEWWDIRIFVGFRDPLGWDQMLLLTGLSVGWSLIVLFFAQLRLEKMDL